MKEDINPEFMYPELKTMKDSEMFVEWALIIKPSGLLKLYVKRIISKKERPAFIKALELEHNIKKDLEYYNHYNYIELITITR